MSVPGCFGDEGVCSVGFWEETVVLFFGVGGIGNGKRRRSGPWSSSYVHYMLILQTVQIYVLMFCITSLILYKQSLQWWFGGGLRLSGPSSGSNGSVRVYRRVFSVSKTGDQCEHYDPNI